MRTIACATGQAVTATVGASGAAIAAVILGREPLADLIFLVFAIALALLIDHYF